MKHTYKIEGMTCSGCEEKVRTALLQIENITAVEVSKDTHSATIDMNNPISLEDLQIPLAPKYKIKANPDNASTEETKSWFETYKPVLLIFIYLFFYSKIANKMRLRNLVVLLVLIALVFSFGKIKERFYVEFQSNSGKSISHNVISGLPEEVHNVSIYEAWGKEKFSPNDFFPGTAFRVYQARLFFEFLKEEPIFWKGFGLNASFVKLEEKGKFYNVFLGNETAEGYQKKNFHNQYFQNFAELGIVGFLLLIMILAINLKKALKSKDFIHIAFAILMISLFLTESFLWRQRGVVFFTAFYCLFNIANNIQTRKN